jgi:hypothetical protein
MFVCLVCENFIITLINVAGILHETKLCFKLAVKTHKPDDDIFGYESVENFGEGDKSSSAEIFVSLKENDAVDYIDK